MSSTASAARLSGRRIRGASTRNRTISKHGVVGIRLPEPDRSKFMHEHSTDLFRGDPAWPPAKEFVAVPDELLVDTAALKPYLELSLRYVQTLKPKPTKPKSD